MAINPQNLQQLVQNAGTQSQNQGTGYTNLNRIMDANKGNQLGQQVAGNITSQIGDVNSQLKAQQDQFNADAMKNQVGSQSDVQNRDQTIAKFAPSSSAVGSGRSDATNQSNQPASGSANSTPASSNTAAPSQTDTANFQKYLSGTYSGPQGLKDTSGLATTASQLQQQTSNLSPSGTQELLRRNAGGNNYTAGQQQLDSLLIDRSALTPVQRQAASLGQNINQANLAASGQAQQYQSQAKNFADQTKGLLSNNMSNIDTSIQGQLKAAQAAEATRQANLGQIQAFTSNQTPQLDVSGNPVKDAYGNVQYTTTRTGDQYAQLDQLNNLLQKQGLSQQNISDIFGQGNLANAGQQYQTLEAQKAAQQADLNRLTDFNTLNTGGQLGWKNNDASPNSNYSNQINTLLNKYNLGDVYNQNLDGRYDTRASQANAALNPLISGSETSAVNALTGTTGIAGQAALKGNTQDFYNQIANTLGQSNQAQNLTAQGVATAQNPQQLTNYNALNQLMGNQSSTSKYQAPTLDANGNPVGAYQAGGYQIDPSLLKKALGF